MCQAGAHAARPLGDGAPLGVPGGVEPAAIAAVAAAGRGPVNLAGLRGRSSPTTGRGGGVGGGLILPVKGDTIAEVSRALRELLIRHVDAGTIPGGVALLGAGNAEVATAGVASIGGGPMGEDAIMRIQSMTKGITSVAALRLVEAGRLDSSSSSLAASSSRTSGLAGRMAVVPASSRCCWP
jgi:CubicO group peptidase (beta-lactamase class C family)